MSSWLFIIYIGNLGFFKPPQVASGYYCHLNLANLIQIYANYLKYYFEIQAMLLDNREKCAFRQQYLFDV